MLELEIDDGLATLTLCRPPVNAISAEWVRLFGERLDSLSEHPGCRALLIRSSQKVFGAGADLAEFGIRLAADGGARAAVAQIGTIQDLYARIEALPMVTVAEIAGAAMGGGLELALACDIRIAACEASLGLPEARLGLIPGAGGTQRLTRLCGQAVSARLILAAETIDGAEAERLGLVQWAVPRADLPDKVAALMAAIRPLSAEAVAEAKRCIAASFDETIDGFALEREASFRLYEREETRTRIADFLGR